MSIFTRPDQLHDALDPLLSRPVSVPTSTDWDLARAAWNLAVPQRPAAVIDASTPDDVLAAVLFANARGMTVAPQGTGHAAASLRLDEDTLLLRTHHMREVVVDPARRVAQVQAGAQLGDVVAAAEPHGLTPLAGSSADVGVIGYLLGGGISWFTRGRGLACHDLLSAEAVTGNGLLLRVDEERHPELLWALRGGGGSSGAIVLSVELRLHRIDDVYAGMMFFPLDRAGEVLPAYAAWSRTAPETATTSVRLLRLPPLPEMPDFLRGQSFVGVTGAVEAPAAAAEAILAPLRALGPALDTFSVVPTTALAAINLDPPGPTPAWGDGMNLTALAPSAVDALLSVAGPDADGFDLLMVDLRHIGGKAGRPHDGNAMLTHLDGEFALFTTGVTPTPESIAAARANVDALLDGMRPWRAGHDYLNYRESTPDPTELHGAPALARLRDVRAAHDPAGLIRSHHPLG